MGAQPAGSEATTYVPEGTELAEVVDFVAALAGKGVDVPAPRPALVAADGAKLELPEPLFEALVQVATRPTLVRLLEAGEMPFQHHGRHRRVRLADLLVYQERMTRKRRESLERMQQEGQAAGLYEATNGGPPPEGE
jgi:excisionase family DNA binding protein